MQALEGLTHMAIWVEVPIADQSFGGRDASAAANLSDGAAADLAPNSDSIPAAAAPSAQGGANPNSSSSSTLVGAPPLSTGAAASAGGVDGRATTCASDDGSEAWEFWWRLLSLCEYSSLLGVILLVPPTLPPVPMVRRWLGQPVKALSVPTTIFGTNKKGYPVLSKPHQDVISLFFKHNVQVGADARCRRWWGENGGC
jgi:protein arginine N-methyltransferase 5